MEANCLHTSRLDISCIEEIRDTMEQGWQNLECQSISTVFQSYFLSKIWFEEIGRPLNYQVQIFQVTKESEVIAIFPFQVKIFFGKKIISFIGTEQFDYTGALINTNFHSSELLHFAWKFIHEFNGKKAIYYFKKIPDTSNIINFGLDDKFRIINKIKCHSIEISKFTKFKNEADIRRQIKKIKNQAKLKFLGINSSRIDFEFYFNKLIEFKENWLRHKLKKNIFSNDKIRNYYKRILLNRRGGFFKLHAILYNNQIAALTLGAFYKDRYYYLVPTYKMNFMNYSWGSILLNYVFILVKKIKFSTFDMTIGDEPYKSKYSNNTFYCQDYYYSNNSLGYLYLIYIKSVLIIKKYIRKLK